MPESDFLAQNQFNSEFCRQQTDATRNNGDIYGGDAQNNFQIKTIVCLMRDVKFIEQIHDILDEKHFDNESIKWIVKNCKEYYKYL